MSGYITEGDKEAKIPVVGDTITAKTDPVEAAELIKYQWYRDDAKITDATNKSYTLTSDDIGYKLGVKIEAIDKSFVELKVDEKKLNIKTADKISNLSIKLNKTTNLQVDDDIIAIVKKGDSDVSDSMSYQWYRDSVSEANKIAGADEKTYTLDDEDMGHTLICVVIGDYTKNYYGKMELSTGKAIREIGAITLKYDTPDGTLSNIGVGNSIKATFEDPKTTATFQWYKDGSAISGATSDTYVLTTSDADETNHKFKVVATGNGNYTGEKSQETASAFETANKARITRFVVTKTSDQKKTPLLHANDVYIGEELCATAVPAAANSNVVFRWYYLNANNEVESTTGTTFTVPANIQTSSDDGKPEVAVCAYYKGDRGDNWLPGATAGKQATNPAAAPIKANDSNNWLVYNTSDWNMSTATSVTAENEDETAYYYLPVTLSNGATPPVYSAATINGNSNTFANAGTAGTAALKLDAYRSLATNTITFDNNSTGNQSATGYKTFDAPEVGIYAHASVTPAIDGLTYKWYLDKVDDAHDITDATGTPLTGGFPGAGSVYDGEGSENLKIHEDFIGHTLICKASAPAVATNRYSAATVLSEASAAVKVSSKTISAIKVAKSNDDLSTKTKFDNYTSVTAMSAGQEYKLVGLDSTGNIISSLSQGVKVKWDGSKMSDFESAITYTAKASDGIITVTMTPDGKNYTGSPVSYTFKTEASDSNGSVNTNEAVKFDYELQNANVFVANNATEYVAKMKDSNGNVTNVNNEYLWSVDTTLTDNGNTGVTIDLESGKIKCSTAKTVVVTATPKSSGLKTLKGTIKFVAAAVSGARLMVGDAPEAGNNVTAATAISGTYTQNASTPTIALTNAKIAYIDQEGRAISAGNTTAATTAATFTQTSGQIPAVTLTSTTTANANATSNALAATASGTTTSVTTSLTYKLTITYDIDGSGTTYAPVEIARDIPVTLTQTS